ncbi:SNF2 family N-terminal domain-containing protein [Blastocladiella britannica]|nr:SNF2 family N-terminal domain-containing protein [Blastocladiella britannica]
MTHCCVNSKKPDPHATLDTATPVDDDDAASLAPTEDTVEVPLTLDPATAAELAETNGDDDNNTEDSAPRSRGRPPGTHTRARDHRRADGLQKLDALQALLDRTGRLASNIAGILNKARAKAQSRRVAGTDPSTAADEAVVPDGAAADSATTATSAPVGRPRKRTAAEALPESHHASSHRLPSEPAPKRARRAAAPRTLKEKDDDEKEFDPSSSSDNDDDKNASKAGVDGQAFVAEHEEEEEDRAVASASASASAPRQRSTRAQDMAASKAARAALESERRKQQRERAAEAELEAAVAATKAERSEFDGLSAVQIADRRYHESFHGTLKDYQEEGVEWLVTLYDSGLNGILADEMGLGKTIQSIAFLCRIRATVTTWGLSMVVAPLSTLANWESEFARFAPEVNVILYHGTPDERAALRVEVNKRMRNAMRAQSAKGLGREQRSKAIMDLPVILTSYEMLMTKFDISWFRSLQFTITIIDEGHRLKNSEGKLFKQLKNMNIHTRYLLTGTPLQNNLKELWSLLHFVMPLVFDDLDTFMGWFDFEVEGASLDRARILTMQMTNQLVTKMHAVLSPFMLRRIKADVNLALPPKKELVVVTPLSQEQSDMFLAIKSKTFPDHMDAQFAAAGLEPPKRSHYKTVRHAGMALRRVCCHPFLFPHPAFPNDYDGDESIVMRSGKLMVLDQLLQALLVDEAPQKHKLLLFSQFTDFLTIVAYYLEMRGWGYVRLCGSVHHLERKEAIKTFHNDPDCQVFLLSTKAGGLGLNLTAADTVVLLDSDWNPQNDLQAMDRAHRMGQTRPVTVFRLISDLEHRVYQRAQAKRQLEKMVIGTGKLNDKTEQGSSSSVADVPSVPVPEGADAAAAAADTVAPAPATSRRSARQQKGAARSSTTTTATDASDGLSDYEGDDPAAVPDQFAEMLAQVLEEEDGERVAVMEKDARHALDAAALQDLLRKRAAWDVVPVSETIEAEVNI